MIIKNPKKNSNPLHDKEFLNVSDSSSFAFEKSKREGWELRHYYEYKSCKSNNGRVFYVTLTYANHALPYFRDLKQFPCPDFRDVRWLLHDSGFSSVLRAKYNVDKINYFVGTELGEGKGSRGYHRNPHYHIVFYLFPFVGSNLNYLDGNSFLNLVKHYWQGTFYRFKGKEYVYSDFVTLDGAFTSDEWLRSFHNEQYYSDKYKPSKMKFGIVSAGREGCEVTRNSGANTYVSKYVCKDVTVRQYECSIYNYFYNQCYNFGKGIQDAEGYEDGYEDNPFFGHEFGEQKFSDTERLLQQRAEAYADDALKEFKRYHSTRIHCSEKFGISMIEEITDYNKPVVKYITKNKVLLRSLPPYIFRKIYYDYDKPTGLYYRNQKGIDLLVSSAQNLLDSHIRSVNSLRDYIFNNSDCSINSSYIDIFRNNFLTFDVKPENILNPLVAYVYFKSFYEGLCFDSRDISVTLNPIADFVQRVTSSESFDAVADYAFPYSLLPCFSENHQFFLWLDSILCDISKNKDSEARKRYEDSARTRKFYNDNFVFKSSF